MLLWLSFSYRTPAARPGIDDASSGGSHSLSHRSSKATVRPNYNHLSGALCYVIPPCLCLHLGSLLPPGKLLFVLPELSRMAPPQRSLCKSPKVVVLQLSCTKMPCKIQIAIPTLTVSVSGLVESRICVSNKFPGDSDATLGAPLP